MGLRAVTLGHADPRVVEAAYRQMLLGVNFNRPTQIEVECAEKLASLIESAEMVKFAKNGSDVTTAAIKLARAYTGRELVAICMDHPFFSVDDWFIGTTEMSAGVPTVVQDLTIKFHYNDINSVKKLFIQYPDQVACLIMEPERLDPPVGNFLEETQQLCQENGALLIFDEILTGFRVHLGGAQRALGIKPDCPRLAKLWGTVSPFRLWWVKKKLWKWAACKQIKNEYFCSPPPMEPQTPSMAAARGNDEDLMSRNTWSIFISTRRTIDCRTSTRR